MSRRRVIHTSLRDDQLPEGDQQILTIAHAIEISVKPADKEVYIKAVVEYIAEQFEFALRAALKLPADFIERP
jgi:hypothetical protein